jgi:hypothetical protein
MADLYAICRSPAGLEVRSVQLSQQVQADLGHILQAQEHAFMDGIQSVIPFTGDWKPDSDELLVINALPEVQILLQAAAQNAVALQPLDPHAFLNQNVVGIFTALGGGQNVRLLVQNFSAQQILQAKFTVLFDGNVFRRLTEPAFTIASNLTAVVDGAGSIRFKSYASLRKILDISPVFRMATDADLATFCAHPSFGVANTQAFVADADEGIRKQVHAINNSGVLVQHTVPAIQNQAAAIGFNITVTAGRIDVPADRKGAKELFSFLLNKVYRGPLNQMLFITNSNRPL